MVRFPSEFSVEELIKRWDEYTSISRFAGNDDTMDLIFLANREENRVKLVRRSRLSREPFASVFRGKIKKTKSGSEIVGFFTKTLLDYIFFAAVIALLFYIRSIIIERGGPLNTINIFIVIALFAMVLLLYNTRASKNRYADFISRITGIEIDDFLSRKERESREEKAEKES